MRSTLFGALLIGVSALAFTGCNKDATADRNAAADNGAAVTNDSSAASADPIESAMSAAPASISRAATIIQPQADGSMKTLRKGSNNWTCMPDMPDTPGPDPMCLDPNALAWAQAWMTHKIPPPNNVGVGYMLAGGVDASNTDPFARQPSAGADWVRTGPHVMIFGADSMLKNYPSGANPDTSVPYVMFAGTPYAHLMAPIGYH